MIRQIGLFITFFLLGLASLWICGAVDLELCHLFPKYCQPGPGVCAEMNKCNNSTLFEFGVLLFYLGPSIIFATVASAFSRHPRSPVFWAALAIVLFLIHLIVMELFRI